MSEIDHAAVLDRQTRTNADLLPKDIYYSREFAELERHRLWPRSWQIACREEELPRVGSYVTYDILDESIIVMRTADDKIKAYNNACLHRGRRLTEGCGKTNRLICKFHGWKWNVDGSIFEVIDRQDWDGSLHDLDLGLREYKVGIWAGMVFVSMSANPEPFEEFLGPVRERLDCFEIEKMRYRWFVTLELDANWKTAIEAFVESYHVVQTHRQLAPYYDDRSTSEVRGKHSQLMFPSDYTPGYRFGGQRSSDARSMVMEYVRQQSEDIRSIYTERDYQAASRILTEVPADATYMEAMERAVGFMAEAAIASGAGYPHLTADQVLQAGFDWNIFPNAVTVLSPSSALWFRSRPSRDNNPDRCIFDIWSLERMAPGAVPPLERRHYTNWRDFKDLPVFLVDDFINIPEVHRGLKTSGFGNIKPNPIQERAITNIHRVLREFVYGEAD